jgi:hypothetical protein
MNFQNIKICFKCPFIKEKIALLVPMISLNYKPLPLISKLIQKSMWLA